jgi:SAUR family protein
MSSKLRGRTETDPHSEARAPLPGGHTRPHLVASGTHIRGTRSQSHTHGPTKPLYILTPAPFPLPTPELNQNATGTAATPPAMEEQHGGRASNKIRDIVRLQQLLKKWKKLATVAPSSSSGKSSVPRGSFAVYVGDEMRRFVIPTEYLGHWAFAELLREAEEEFGFRHEGALRIPCDVEAFEGILRVVQQQGTKRHADDMCRHSETEILCR